MFKQIKALTDYPRVSRWQKREQQKKGTSIEVLSLPQQILNRLRYTGIDTIEELIEYSFEDLLEVKGIGVKKAEQIQKALKKINRELGLPGRIVPEAPLTYSCIRLLSYAGIETYDSLVVKTPEELLKIPGVGKKRVQAIQTVVGRKFNIIF